MFPLLQGTLLSLFIIAFFSGFPTFAADRRSQVTPTAPQSRLVPGAFARGESLTYTALLNELPAGDAAIRLRKEQQSGRDVYRATVQANSSEWVDYLVRLRSAADGMFTASGFTPLRFHLTYTYGERQRELGVRYDPAAKMLLGSAKRRDREKERTVPAANAYDPVTAFYFLRSSNLTPGKPLQVEVFTGKERYRIAAQVIRKENVLLTTGTRPALRLHPAVFSLDDAPQENLLPQETTLWVTTDATHTPLKLESFLPIGRLVVELSQ
ncbi:MAG: DUF3108 domain-containing protein [Candidatus Binatia bacterium]